MAIHTVEKVGDVIRITHKHTINDINGVPFETISGTNEISVSEYQAQIDRCDSQITSYQDEKARLQQVLTDLNLQVVDGVVVDKVVEPII